MSKPRIHWATPEYDMVSNALGYATHNKFMRKYCQEVLEFDDQADIALQILSADKFIPIPGKFNVLFTMWEFLDLPKSYIERIDMADALIVPCSFCRDLFRRYTKKPIYVCWEGIEPELYPFYDRAAAYHPGKKFRFLWVSAPNPRKGYPFVLNAVKVFEKAPNVEIYIKTTAPKANAEQTVEKILSDKYMKENFPQDRLDTLKQHINELPNKMIADNYQVMGEHQNIIFDTRKISNEALRDLYNSAHCFLLPTLGEGWGLTLCEAMATGCPSIATEVTGVADFFNGDVGFPIKYDIIDQELENYDLKTKGYVPNPMDFLEQMFYVVEHYAEALRKGKRASDRIHGKFTWRNSAKRMLWITQDIMKNHYQHKTLEL